MWRLLCFVDYTQWWLCDSTVKSIPIDMIYVLLYGIQVIGSKTTKHSAVKKKLIVSNFGLKKTANLKVQ